MFEKNNYELNEKIDNYIKWYYKYLNKKYKSKEYSYKESKKMLYFIEKLAIWYEFKYPNNEVLNTLFKKKELNNLELFDTRKFITSLPSNEKEYFNRPKYTNLVYFKYPELSHMYLTSKGKVKSVSGVYGAYAGFKGKHVKDVVKHFKEKKINYYYYHELEKAINKYENETYQKEEMLNCVMYRLIERDNEYGAKRAFLFAKEFKRNIDIPLIYGINYQDRYLRLFINEYLKSGGSKDLVCLDDFALRGKNNEKLDKVTINEVLQKCKYSFKQKYTPEEKDLHQRIINVLVNQKNIKEQENIKKLTLKN